MLARAATSNAHRRSRLNLLGLMWLVLALIGAQSLGFMHRVVHGANGSGVGVAARVAETTGTGIAAATAPRVSEAGVAGLFFGHDGKTVCPLFDGLTAPGIAPTVALVVAAVVLPNERLRTFAAEFVARWATLFDARGPPDFR